MQANGLCRPRGRYVEGFFAIDWMLRLGKVRCEAGRVPDRSGEKAEENSKWKCDRCAEVRPKGGVGFGVRLIRNICAPRSEEHTSELQSLMRISYAVFCLQQKKIKIRRKTNN